MNTNPCTLPAISRRAFMRSAAAAGTAWAARGFAASAPQLPSMLGPLLGHMEPTRALIWLRPNRPGEYELEVAPMASGDGRTFFARAVEEDDLCIHWRVDGLKPATAYRYRISSAGKGIAVEPAQTFRTPPLSETPPGSGSRSVPVLEKTPEVELPGTEWRSRKAMRLFS